MTLDVQGLLFPEESGPTKYTPAIGAPIYVPRGHQPALRNLVDTTASRRLEYALEGAAELTADERYFLRLAAQRHNVFHYERIADYYAHASTPMQREMERSALVIIDFGAAIERGFVRLSNEVRSLYLEDYRGE